MFQFLQNNPIYLKIITKNKLNVEEKQAQQLTMFAHKNVAV